MRKTWFIILMVLVVVTAALSLPVSAKIQYTADVKFDPGNALPGFGEEIPVTLIISPGENDIKNLIIDIREADALIDDTNPNLITKTISPVGAAIPVNLTNQHTFSIDQLLKGQTLTIAFNAYPKTLRQQALHVADIGFSYTQLGDRIEQPYEPISANLEQSSWFQLQKIQSEDAILRQDTRIQRDNATTVFYGSIVLILAAFAAIAYFWMKRRESVKECADLKESKNQLMQELLRKVELAEDNKAELESLKKKIRNELGPDTGSGITGTKDSGSKESLSEMKDSGFE